MVTYHEHILKKGKTGKDLAICLVSPFVLAFCAYAFSFLFIYVIPFFSFLIPALWVGAVYFSFKVISSRNIEFEYLLTDSDLDIDKIINKSRRRRIISIYRKEIIAMAPVTSTNLPENWQKSEIIDASSSVTSPDTYVLIVQQEGVQKAIYFCPTEAMLETMIARNPRKVFKD